MALGKELGTFDLKVTSLTLSPGKKKRLIATANFEGTITGRKDGTVVATMSVDSPDGKDGKYKIYTRTLFADGDIQDAIGHGSTTHTGDHKWLTAGIAEATNNRSYAIKGEIDFPSRRFTGTLYSRAGSENG